MDQAYILATGPLSSYLSDSTTQKKLSATAPFQNVVDLTDVNQNNIRKYFIMFFKALNLKEGMLLTFNANS